MQACLSLVFGAHDSRISGAAMAAVAAVCKNFRRDTEKDWSFMV
jgi:hypothetical protein